MTQTRRRGRTVMVGLLVLLSAACSSAIDGVATTDPLASIPALVPGSADASGSTTASSSATPASSPVGTTTGTTSSASNSSPSTTPSAPPSSTVSSPSAGPSKSVVIGIDLPLQGSLASVSDSTVKMVRLYLDQVGGRAGNTTVTLKIYDDASAASGINPDTCAKNAAAHVANAAEVAVLGPFTVECAKAQLPILNKASMLLVSHSNTYPGLTRPWGEGEPDKYYPTGKRTYGRVITIDAEQGTAAVAFIRGISGKKCFVLSDGSLYGAGLAQVFANSAKANAVAIVGQAQWPAKGSTSAVLGQAKAAGANCLYLGGLYENNGKQLLQDKANILGDNNKVMMIASDGWTGYGDLNTLPQAQGMYATFAGLTLSELLKSSPAAVKLVAAYHTKYGTDPADLRRSTGWPRSRSSWPQWPGPTAPGPGWWARFCRAAV